VKFLQGTGLLPTAEELQPLTDDQSLAILESLFLTVIADGKIEPNEVKAFAVSALSYPFNWGNSPDTVKAKLDAIAARIKDVTRASMKDYLKALGPRIPTQTLREKTFAGMFALMLADGKLDDKEKTAALAFSSVFSIPQARAVELINQVTNALLGAAKQ
jgi:uncharacterized tellurite resistance protein B-like protein